MTPLDLIAAVGVAWVLTAVYIYRTHMAKKEYTKEDMATAYSMGYDSRSKNIGMLIRKFDEVVSLGKRLRVNCEDQIACEEFDKLVKEIERPATKE